MTLTINDLKLFESENMTNFSNGGGTMSSNVIIDGASNNIFPDVTEQDRAYGHVHERKLFMGISSQNNDAIYSAMSYVSKLPLDEKINVNLAKSELWFDERSDRIVKEKKTILPNFLASYTVVPIRLTYNNTIFGYMFDDKYNFPENINGIYKQFNCFFNGNLSIGDTTIDIFGTDGKASILDTEQERNAQCFGISLLENVFKNNTFVIKNGTIEERINVVDIKFTLYENASSAIGTTTVWDNDLNDFLDGENGQTYYSTSVPYQTVSATPVKKYKATLTLRNPIQHNFVGSNPNSKSTWLSCETFLYTVKLTTELTTKKFYTAKKTTAIASTGSTSIAISSNTNQIIPVLDGLILDSQIVGINTTEFEEDGNYYAFLTGDVIIILNDKETTGTYTNAQTVTLTRTNLSKITVRDAANNLVDTSKFTVNLNAGTVTFTNVSGLSQPLTITDRIEDMGLVTGVTDTSITLYKPLTHTYPVEGTIVANCLLHGTLQAAASLPFDQQTWTNVWQDTAIGSTVSAQYNFIDHPISVTNYSAIEERWAIVFNTPTTFNLISEHLGTVLYNASTANDLAPINPHTAHPYFVLPAAGLGSGWVAGNVIRFDTYAAAAPFWILQSVAQGQATNPNFDFAIECRGEIDAA